MSSSVRWRPGVKPLLVLVVCVVMGTLATPVTGPSVSGLSAADVRPAAASTGTANPLADGTWGVYTSKHDDAYKRYVRATGTTKTLLGKIALRPRVRWFGTWIPTAQVGKKIRKYVKVSQKRDPNALVQFATFRLWPNGGEAGRNHPLSAAQQADYRAWYRAVAAAIGNARVAVVLEPDLAMALKGWSPATRLAMTRYAAQTLSALPRTSVYIDASDADWLQPDAAASMLKAAGVQYARGFALGATHYWSVPEQIAYTRQVVARLDTAGITGKRSVIDTADNGKPFTWSQYWAEHPRGDFDNAEVCRSKADTTCDTLGIPPTWRTAAPDVVDAYLWFGRPWLTRQASPWNQARALAVAATTPY